MSSAHFFYGQDPGLGYFHVGPGFGSNKQGFCFDPQQHAPQAHFDLSKSYLQDRLLSNPPVKCILHIAHDLVLWRGSIGDSQPNAYCQKLQFVTGEAPRRSRTACGQIWMRTGSLQVVQTNIRNVREREPWLH